MLKKIMTVCIAAIMVLSLGACGNLVTRVPEEETLGRYVDLSETTITATSIEIGDSITFGKYEQDNNASNGKEKIEWLVLDKQGNCFLIISKYALDCQRYNSSHGDVTWEQCTLRTWLNGTFLNGAFSSDEQSMILTTTVTADENPLHSIDPGNDTQDKVFLLSIAEAKKYFSSDSERECKTTDYAVAQGAYNGSKVNCCWWLRSPGYYSSHAAYVDGFGNIEYDGYGVRNDGDAVRPALWINLES